MIISLITQYFKINCYVKFTMMFYFLRDSLIVSIGNCLTSVFAGFVIFSFLGYLADQEETTVDGVVDSGKHW